ncbi:MAG: NUDIX hydrolase, partial [Desulfohalobiaceae bacterium]
MHQAQLQTLIQSLPKHPGLMHKERHFNAAVLIPLVEQDQEYYFLFQKRAAHIRQGGEISFPGGEFEPGQDQSCLQAALREAREELGISAEKIKVKGNLDTFVSPRGITIDSFLAVLDIQGLEELTPDRREVEDLFLLPVSWFLQNEPRVYNLKLEIKPIYTDTDGNKAQLPVQELGLPEHYEKPWPGMEYRVFVYQTPKAVIWGLTAELVHYLVQRLQ